MEMIGQVSSVESLRVGLRLAAYVPGEEGYHEARTAWNLNARQRLAVTWLEFRLYSLTTVYE